MREYILIFKKSRKEKKFPTITKHIKEVTVTMSKPKDTIRRKRLIKNIASSKTLAEAATKSGYSPTSKAIYSNTMKEYIKGKLQASGYSREALKAEFERIAELCESKGDFSSLLRALEAIQKYHLRDNTSVNTAIFNLTESDSNLLRDKLKR